MKKHFILIIVVFILVAGLLVAGHLKTTINKPTIVQASSKEAWPTDKITDRHAFLEGVIFAQQEMNDMRLKAAISARLDPKGILSGLEGVLILVEDVDPKAEKYGLTRQLLKTQTELRLRQHGIRVFTEKENLQNYEHLLDQGKKRFENLPLELRSVTESFDENDSDEHFLQTLREIIQQTERQPLLPGAAFLHIHVSTGVDEERRLAESIIRVEFKEDAFVCRDGAFCCASVWQKVGVATCSLSDLKDFVRDALRNYVDEFINDYLAANPNDRSSEKK